MAAPDFGIRRGRLFERMVLGESNDGEQFGRVLLEPLQVHLGEVGGGDRTVAHHRREFADAPEGQILIILRRLGFLGAGEGGLKARGALRRDTIGKSGVEGDSRLGIVRDIDLADGLVGVERAVDVAQHLLDLGILELQAEQFESRRHLLLGYSHGLLCPTPLLRRGRRRPGWSRGGPFLRKGGTRRGEDAHQLQPGSSVHKPPHDTPRGLVALDTPNERDG